MLCEELADVAQLVEHSLGKGEVISSILIIGSRNWVVEIGGPGSRRNVANYVSTSKLTVDS